jgi:hypothetical protein
MRYWLKARVDQLFTVLFVGLLLPIGVHGPASEGLSWFVAVDTTRTGVHAERCQLKMPAMRWAEVRDKEDSVYYRAGSGARVRKPPSPGGDEELRLKRCWDALRDLVIYQRYEKEPSLIFPEDAYSQPPK